LYVKH